MPHTTKSCEYWGQQTKWCISAKTGSAFDLYHNKNPIFIFLARASKEERSDAPALLPARRG